VKIAAAGVQHVCGAAYDSGTSLTTIICRPIICRTHAARVRHVIVVRDRKRVFLAERERERASLCGAACVRHIIVVWGGYD